MRESEREGLFNEARLLGDGPLFLLVCVCVYTDGSSCV